MLTSENSNQKVIKANYLLNVNYIRVHQSSRGSSVPTQVITKYISGEQHVMHTFSCGTNSSSGVVIEEEVSHDKNQYHPFWIALVSAVSHG